MDLKEGTLLAQQCYAIGLSKIWLPGLMQNMTICINVWPLYIKVAYAFMYKNDGYDLTAASGLYNERV